VLVIKIDEYGGSLCLLMPSVLCNIGGLGEFGEKRESEYAKGKNGRKEIESELRRGVGVGH